MIVPDVSPDRPALARRVADWLTETVSTTPGPFALALSGGSTPKDLYRLLTDAPYATRWPWERVDVFFGDERFVAPDDPRFNEAMARAALLDHVALAPARIHGVATVGLTPATAAARYDAVLRACSAAREGRPLFDVVLLGLGEDGHTASLFPDTAALDERAAWVVAIEGAKDEPRISLTYPALESAADVAFLVSGADKREMLGRLLAGDESIPAGRLRPSGRLRVFADAAAMGA